MNQPRKSLSRYENCNKSSLDMLNPFSQSFKSSPTNYKFVFYIFSNDIFFLSGEAQLLINTIID